MKKYPVVLSELHVTWCAYSKEKLDNNMKNYKNFYFEMYS